MDSDDSASQAQKEESKVKDQNFMTRQLQDWLNAGDFAKAYKFTSGRMTKGQKNSMFYAVITAYCQLKLGKSQECLDILGEYKNIKPTDSQTAKYIVAIYNNLGRYHDATNMLEYILTVFPQKKELQEQLFFSYVRENKLLKQQNQALTLYKTHQLEVYAEWAVESMYLISNNLKFETKVIDIAYLLMLKLMKEPNFKFDKKFVLLYIKILTKQSKFKEAIDFIERRNEFFPEKIERQNLEIDLYY